MDLTMTDPAGAKSADDLLIDRAAAGDTAALAELFGRYRKRLRAMVRLLKSCPTPKRRKCSDWSPQRPASATSAR